MGRRPTLLYTVQTLYRYYRLQRILLTSKQRCIGNIGLVMKLVDGDNRR